MRNSNTAAQQRSMQPACSSNTAAAQQHSSHLSTPSLTPTSLPSHTGVYTMNAVVAETPEEERSKLNLRVKELLAFPE